MHQFQTGICCIWCKDFRGTTHNSVLCHNQFERSIKQKLNIAFSHYKYYFKDDSLPIIYTYISGVNYEEPIVVNENEILIGIDLFYGEDYEVYNQLQIPKYISKKNGQTFFMRLVCSLDRPDKPFKLALLKCKRGLYDAVLRDTICICTYYS